MSLLPASSRDIAILSRIRATGGVMEPVWDSGAHSGWSYVPGMNAAQNAQLEGFLRSMVSGGWLATAFVDRMPVCPGCGSRHLVIRETCLRCGSSDLEEELLVQHFRCGYVGRRASFGVRPRPTGDELVCPKCRGVLRHPGTDHDRPAHVMSCRACGTAQQDPPVQAHCMDCSRTAKAEALAWRRIERYRLTPDAERALDAVPATRLLEGLVATGRAPQAQAASPLDRETAPFKAPIAAGPPVKPRLAASAVPIARAIEPPLTKAAIEEIVRREVRDALSLPAMRLIADTKRITEAIAQVEELTRRLDPSRVMGMLSPETMLVLMKGADMQATRGLADQLSRSGGPVRDASVIDLAARRRAKAPESAGIQPPPVGRARAAI